MDRHRRHYWLVALLAVCICSPVRVSAQEPGLAERFRTEAPKRWTEYRAFAERLQGRVTAFHTLDEKIFAHYWAEIKQNRDCKLVLFQSLMTDSPAGKVNAYNQKYGFQLRRPAEDRNWAMTGFELPQSQDGTWARLVRRTDQLLDHTYPLLRLYTEYLPDIVKLPTFRVLSATRVVLDRADLVRIEFDNAHPVVATDPNFCPIQNGVIILDPDRYWCVRSCDLHNKYAHRDTKTVVSLDYQLSKTGHPIPTKLVTLHEYVGANPPSAIKYTIEYAFEDPARLPPDEEFTLSAFGLPEPVGVMWEKPTPRYVWFLLGAGGFAALMIGFRYLARRRATKSPAPT